MKSCLIYFLVCLLGVSRATADDIEAYFPGGAPGRFYVHVLMDLGDSDLDIVLCTYGVDCGPPFMTEAAHRHLGRMYLEGEAVTAPGVFKAVLAAVLEHTQFDDLYLSLLISNHPDNQASALDAKRGGGTLLQGYRRLQEHRTEFITTLESTPVLASGNTHVLQPRESFFEWLRYIRGGEVALGENTRGNYGQSDPVPDYDRDIIANGEYLAPFTDQPGCPRLYSILFTQGVSTRDEDLNVQIAAELSPASQTSFEQMLSYMHNSTTDLLPQMDANVALQKTWVVTSRDRPGEAAELAVAGGGGSVLYVNEPLELQASLTKALADIITVGSALPDAIFVEDVFNQGRILDTLFFPLFLPQGNTSWPGNLKKLKLENSQGTGEAAIGSDNGIFDQVVDVRGDPAFELEGDDQGQLRFDALTFWTDVATLPPGDGETIPDNADGRVVARGGAGQKIDGFVDYSTDQGGVVRYFIGDTNADSPVEGYPPRQLFYEPQVGREFAPFDANATTLEVLKPLLDPRGELTDEAILNLIKWARGQDTDNGESTARDWIMGEVMHSRPVALNYGATSGYSRSNPNIRLLFGSGEGVFHILENTDTNANETGREVFGFYPRALMADISLRHENTTTALSKRYGVDGAPVVLKNDRNGDGTIDHTAGDEAYVYFGLRRGGSSYFALDISNPDAVPGLLWKIDPTAGGSFEELGLTFSTPVVGKINYNGVPVDVLVFAGGYNGGWNADYTARRGKDLSADDDAVGNAIYIVNARTGELVWKAVRGVTGASSNTHYEHAGLVDSIPSTVSALVTPAGIIHRVYVGDSGGAVWRVDLPQSHGGDDNHRRDQWFITKLADLGFDAAESGGAAGEDRRFFHAPDIVHSFDDAGDFDGVLIQSGNRADPNETLVENYLFYIKDRQIESGSDLVRAQNDVSHPPGRYHFTDLLDQTTCIVGTEEVTQDEDSIGCADRVLESGWKVRYVEPGEKGLSTPLTDGGRVFVSTFIPGDANVCSSRLGRGQLHVLQLKDATAVANTQRQYELGPGIPFAAVPVADAIFLPGGGIDLYDLDGDGVRDTTQFLPSQAGKFYRTYWREPDVDPL